MIKLLQLIGMVLLLFSCFNFLVMVPAYLKDIVMLLRHMVAGGKE